MSVNDVLVGGEFAGDIEKKLSLSLKMLCEQLLSGERESISLVCYHHLSQLARYCCRYVYQIDRANAALVFQRVWRNRKSRFTLNATITERIRAKWEKQKEAELKQSESYKAEQVKVYMLLLVTVCA